MPGFPAHLGSSSRTVEPTAQSPPTPPSSNEAGLIGVVIICHGRLAQELISATEFIVGPVSQIEAIATGREYDIDRLHEQIEQSIARVSAGSGVLILTDMFGGTPSNLGLSFLDENKVEILTGVNLPMLIKLAQIRQKYDLRGLAEFLKGYAQRNIVLASDILKPQRAAGGGS